MKLRSVVYAAAIAAAAFIAAIGSATPGFAKHKKKMAAPASPFCSEWYKPVCGIKGGVQWNTYANGCFARMDGAKVVHAGACKKPAAKHHKWHHHKKAHHHKKMHHHMKMHHKAAHHHMKKHHKAAHHHMKAHKKAMKKPAMKKAPSKKPAPKKPAKK